MKNGDDPYVELREGVRYVRDSRMPLESLVWLWCDGQSAEAIHEAYLTLCLAEIYSASAYYLDHQSEVDQELTEDRARFDALRVESQAPRPSPRRRASRPAGP